GGLSLPDLAEVAAADELDGLVALGKEVLSGRRRRGRRRLWRLRRLLELRRRLLRRPLARPLLHLREPVRETSPVAFNLRLVTVAVADAVLFDDQVERDWVELGINRLVGLNERPAALTPGALHVEFHIFDEDRPAERIAGGRQEWLPVID